MYGWSTVVRCVQYVLRTDGMIPLPHTGIARPGWSLSCWSLTLTSTLHCIRIRIRPSAPRNLLYYTITVHTKTMKLICHRIDRPAMAVPCLLLSTHIPDHYPWRAINSQSPPITSNHLHITPFPRRRRHTARPSRIGDVAASWLSPARSCCLRDGGDACVCVCVCVCPSLTSRCRCCYATCYSLLAAGAAAV